MARISVVRTVGTYRVTLAGRLMAADLKRLERACRLNRQRRFAVRQACCLRLR